MKVALSLLVCLVLAACGGGDDPPPAEDPPEQPRKTIDPPDCRASEPQCTAITR